MSYYYLDEDGNRHSYLPRIWKGLTPFTGQLAIEKGWTRIDQIDPVPEPEDTTERDGAERLIVGLIVELARRYDAVSELTRLTDITIPALLDVATRYGVTPADLQSAETNILILARHLEAITGMTWGETWDGLKSRFSGYLTVILNQNDGGKNEN